ncbi:hypothetical protein [Streptomyces sp. NPDC051214]|uniref:hypothetical protein n=1 Tax=Streptomyces sp. NPDC051214 TaxID=3155282 RepID=UPI003418A00D
MGVPDEAKKKSEELAGQAQDAFGRVTEERDLDTAGKGDQVKNDAEDASGQGKDPSGQ